MTQRLGNGEGNGNFLGYLRIAPVRYAITFGFTFIPSSRSQTVKAEDRIPIHCPLCDKLLAGRINLNRHIKLHKKRGDEVPDPETLKQYAQEKVAEQQEQQQQQQQQQEEEQQQHQQDELEAAQQQVALQQAALQPQLDLVTMLQTGQLQQVLTVDEQGNQQIVFQMVTPDGQSLLTDPATTQQLLIQQQQLFAATQLANQQVRSLPLSFSILSNQ